MEWEVVRLAMIASGGGMAGATTCGAWTAIGICWGKNEETTVVMVRWVIVERATARPREVLLRPRLEERPPRWE